MKGFLILIFGCLIGFILYSHKVYTLAGMNPIILMISMVILLFIVIALLSCALILYRNRCLKGQITTLQGFYFVLTTFSVGIIIQQIGFYFSFIRNSQPVFTYYFGDLEELIKRDYGLGGFSILIEIIEQYTILFLVIALISLIVAKIFSQSPPSV